MAVIFTNGLKHQMPVAYNFGFDSQLAFGLVNADSDWWASGNALASGNNDRGVRVDLDESGELWIGAKSKGDTANTHARVATINIDGVRVLQLTWNPSESANVGVPGQGFGVFDGTDDEVALNEANLLASGGQGKVPQTQIWNWQLHLTRGISEGTVEVIVDDEVIISFATGILADAAGPIDRVNFTSRATSTSTLGGRYVRHTDVWIDNERDWGSAVVALLVPAVQGFHDDGTLTGGGTKVEAVSNTPPDTTKYLTLSPGDKQSFEMSAPVTDRAAVAAINLRPLAESSFDVGGFVRSGGVDEGLTTMVAQGGSIEWYSGIVEINPHTLAPFTLTELDGLEIGLEVPS